MLDLSDGLSRNLRHICRQSGVGTVIDASFVPIHFDAIELSKLDGRDSEHALHDGEDHELLFTAAMQINHPSIVRIGNVMPDPRIWLDQGGQRTELLPGGWQHQLCAWSTKSRRDSFGIRS